MVYVSQTYTMMVPYLKGVYLTLNLWRKGWDKNGWMTKKARTDARRGILQNDGPPPKWTKIVPRFKTDVEALMRLTAAAAPPDVSIRATNAKAVYVVGDASGAGFGSAMWSQGSERVDVEFGKWLPTVAE